MPKEKASHFFSKQRTVQMPTKTGRHTQSGRTAEATPEPLNRRLQTQHSACTVILHHPACPAPPQPSQHMVLHNHTCLKVAELQKAVLPGWVVFADSALPPAASPFLEHHLEAGSMLPPPPAAHPQATSFDHSGQPLRLPAGNT